MAMWRIHRNSLNEYNRNSVRREVCILVSGYWSDYPHNRFFGVFHWRRSSFFLRSITIHWITPFSNKVWAKKYFTHVSTWPDCFFKRKRKNGKVYTVNQRGQQWLSGSMTLLQYLWYLAILDIYIYIYIYLFFYLFQYLWEFPFLLSNTRGKKIIPVGSMQQLACNADLADNIRIRKASLCSLLA
jgi:hypothetical protein